MTLLRIANWRYRAIWIGLGLVLALAAPLPRFRICRRQTAPALVRLNRYGPAYFAIVEHRNDGGHDTSLVYHVASGGSITIGKDSDTDMMVYVGGYESFVDGFIKNVQAGISTPSGYRLLGEGNVYVHFPVEIPGCSFDYLDRLSCQTDGVYHVVERPKGPHGTEFSIIGPGVTPPGAVQAYPAYSRDYAQQLLLDKARESLAVLGQSVYIATDIPVPAGCMLSPDRRFTCMQDSDM